MIEITMGIKRANEFKMFIWDPVLLVFSQHQQLLFLEFFWRSLPHIRLGHLSIPSL